MVYARRVWSQRHRQGSGGMVRAGGRVCLGGTGSCRDSDATGRSGRCNRAGMTPHEALRVCDNIRGGGARLATGRWFARGGQARRPDRARQRSAERDSQHGLDPLGDEERRDVRWRHAGSGMASAEEARQDVLVEQRACDCWCREIGSESAFWSAATCRRFGVRKAALQ